MASRCPKCGWQPCRCDPAAFVERSRQARVGALRKEADRLRFFIGGREDQERAVQEEIAYQDQLNNFPLRNRRP